MRIVQLQHSTGVGGAEKLVYTLAVGLRAQGHEVIYLGPVKCWLGEMLLQEGFECHALPFHGLGDLYSLLRAAWIVRRRKVDVINAHMQRSSWYNGLIGRLTGIPTINSAQSPFAWRYFGLSHEVLAVAGAVRDRLVAHGVAAERISVVYNGVLPITRSEDRRRQLRAEWGLSDGQVASGMISRLLHQKGHDLALRALAGNPALAAQTLIIAGPTDTPWASQMQALATELGVAARVRFIGMVQDIAGFYSALDILVAPSRGEAFSLTLLEAASAGLAIVASDVGGNAEAIPDGDCGLIVPNEDHPALGEAWARLVQSAELRARFGAAAQARYRAQFSDRAMIDNTLKAYRKVIARVRGAAVAAATTGN